MIHGINDKWRCRSTGDKHGETPFVTDDSRLFRHTDIVVHVRSVMGFR